MIKFSLAALLLPLVSFAQNDPISDSLEDVVSVLAKPVYVETYKVVNTAKYKVDNAISGQYPIKDALRYYNDNLSHYMGNYKTIQAIKKRLDETGDDFIEFVFLKEKARIAKELADQSNERVLEIQAEESFDNKLNNKNRAADISQDIKALEVFTKVEVEAQYPGNWESFLERNLDLDVAVDNGAPPGDHTVIIQFIVDVTGNLSDVKAVTKVGYGMEQEAMRIIKKSGRWKPAIQNGQEVKAFRKQSISFKVSS
ncbi:hypothetical protein GCM10027051_35940 [Niabella terrae]